MWLDDLVGVFSPKARFRRMQFRRAAELLDKAGRKYEGASRTRRTAKWFTSSSSANSENSGQMSVLRDRARDLVRNDPYAKRIVSIISSNTVGKGIRPNILGVNDQATDSLQNMWKLWAESPICDYEGNLSFYGIQNLCMASQVESGEVLVRRRRVMDGPLPIRLQVLESDHLATDMLKNTANDNPVIQGIEYDRNGGAPVAYWLYSEHPGNYGATTFDFKKQTNIVRIPAEDVCHVFRKDRPGQGRGITWLAPVMIMLRDLSEFQDFMLVRQKVAACFGAFITDAEAPLDQTSGSDSFDLEHLEPGIVEYLPAGKDIKFGSPPLPPTGSYESYIRVLLHAVASGSGPTYEAMTSDLNEVNFSSARMGWLEFARFIDSWRSLGLIPQLCDKTFGWFLEAAALVGENTEGAAVTWTAPARQMIDPTKEVPAAISGIRAGIYSLSDVIRQYGKHPGTHLEEIRKDNETIDSLGLVLDSDPRKVDQQGERHDTEEGGGEA